MHLRIRIRFWLSDTVRFPRFVRRGSGGRGVIVVRIPARLDIPRRYDPMGFLPEFPRRTQQTLARKTSM